MNELPSSTVRREKLEGKENDQRRPLTAPREAKKTRKKQPPASKYDGYEELLNVKPDPAFVEPKGMGVKACAAQPALLLRAWQHRCSWLRCCCVGVMAFSKTAWISPVTLAHRKGLKTRQSQFPGLSTAHIKAQ